jgi:O-antigen/teichoic acid export membrane protein
MRACAPRAVKRDMATEQIVPTERQVDRATAVPPPAVKARKGGARSVFHSMSAKLFIVALNAGTGILTARALHPQGRGELAAILLWPQLLSGMLTLGLPSAITYYVRLQPRRTTAFLWSGLVLTFLIGAIATFFAILFAPYLLHQYSPAVIEVARWLMPNLIIGIYLLIGRAALEADKEFLKSGFVLTGPPLLTLIGLTALALVHHLTPFSAAVTYTLSGVPACIYLFRQLPVTVRQTLRETVDAGKTLLSYGIRSYGIDLCGTLGYYLDQALVVSLLSPEKMGVYVVALSASRVMNVPQQALAAVLFPSMVGSSQEKIGDLVKLALRVGGTLALLSSVATFFCGGLLLRLLYGSSFATVGGVLAILTAEAALSGCVTIIAQAFMAFNRPGLITTQQILGLSFSVPCLLLLIPRYGVAGAAAAVLISTGARFVFAMFSFTRRFGGRIPSLLMDQESVSWFRTQISRSFLGAKSVAATGELA